ncbi:MAG TPA: PilZ domain-containing protein [Candidatus Acidoferrales bacterium]
MSSPVRQKRRSDRVALTIPVEVAGEDSAGTYFQESARTLIISRHGATLVMGTKLKPHQDVVLRCPGTQKKGHARLVGSIGGQADGHVYGFALLKADPRFWGIAFPPVEESENAVARVLLECMDCNSRELTYLDELELEVFEANRSLSRECSSCREVTVWVRAAQEDGQHLKRPAGDASRQNQRRQVRIRVKMRACIRHPGFGDELVEVENVSRGGLCFVSPKRYLNGSSVEVALPFEQGAANVFVRARVVRSSEVTRGNQRYGISYIGTPEKD